MPVRDEPPEDLEPSVVTRRLLPIFERHPEILCAYLFGSRARGTHRPASDYDIAVLTRRRDHETRERWRTYWGDLHAELASALGVHSRHLDLVLLDQVRDPVLRHRATWLGRRIFSRDEAARVGLETETLIQLMDTAHLRLLQRDALKRALRPAHGT